MIFNYFASAAVAVDSSHMTVSSCASRSRFSPPSNFVSGHVSTMWFMVCRWPQSQESFYVTIRWSAYDFLFDFNRNCASISYRFRNRASYLSKVADFNLPHLHLAPPWGWSRWNFAKIFGIRKLKSPGLSRGVVSVICFSRTPTCDRHRQTDRWTLGRSIYRASIASRGKNR